MGFIDMINNSLEINSYEKVQGVGDDKSALSQHKLVDVVCFGCIRILEN